MKKVVEICTNLLYIRNRNKKRRGGGGTPMYFMIEVAIKKGGIDPSRAFPAGATVSILAATSSKFTLLSTEGVV